MADLEPLSRAFLSDHPGAAARVLEELPPEQAAALFAREPARLGAPVLAAMLPPGAAACVTALSPDQAALLLAAARLPAVASILRHVREPLRTALLDALPTAAAVTCRALLRYPDDAVGACIDTRVLALTGTTSAQAALERVREADGALEGRVFLVDERRRPLGTIDLSALLRAPAPARLSTLAGPAPPTLAAVMPLATAIGDPLWETRALAAVVERGERLIGVLDRAALVAALEQRARPSAAAPESLGALIARGYWDALLALSEAAVSLHPGSSRMR